MASVQTWFEAFHDAIKLGRFEEEQELREKRDIIRDKLLERLPAVFAAHGEDYPEPCFYDQGSYDMRTGIKPPIEGDYDIDQGLYFPISEQAYPDPVILKRRVYEALEGHASDVRVRQPCVTVFYQCEEEPLYHVDIAVYADGSQYADGKPRLARGKLHSSVENRVWEISDPQGLVTTIEARFDEPGLAQFRRCVRYLKRWKDANFPCEGHAAPRGIALTVAAHYFLQPSYSDWWAKVPDDLTALRAFVDTLLNQFTVQWDAETGTYVRRLALTLPVEPHGDLLQKMTARQMGDFEARLRNLQATLDAVANAVDPIDACEALQGVFGDDFPVPSPQETAKRHNPAIVSSSSSA